jgi:aspartate racemase
MSEKTVGILGGMGPEATVDLMARIIKATPARDDIDHIRMVVDNNPKVPSRIKALIEKTGESPIPCLQEMARKLTAWGVDFLAMPCNTAHYYHPDVQAAVSIPVLDMIELTVTTVTQQTPGIKTVGLLASTAVLDLGLYTDRFASSDVRLITPAAAIQDEVMNAIKTIKTGSYGQEEVKILQQAAEQLVAHRAEALLVACTELSILTSQLDSPVDLYDSAQILAEAIVQTARTGQAD